MSFLKDAFKWVSGNSLGATLARTAVSGFLLNRIQKSINSDNQTAAQQKNKGSVVTINPSVDNIVPIIYGETFTTGTLVDAVMSSNNKTMWFVFALSEKTGTLLDGVTPSNFEFIEVYWNGLKIDFKSDGITASQLRDTYGNTNNDIDGLVSVYCFKDGSVNPTVPVGFRNNSLTTANNIIPGWTSSHLMSKLVFAIVRVDYNSEKNITSLGQVKFKIRNSMSSPGDVLYDYMTNNVYGAGIPIEGINT